jgi:CheY-like chemotaxis protein
VRLRLEVQDTGIGIAPEHLAILGTAFNQVDGSITRRFGGTGLGLAISKQLVEQMEGSFGVDSTLGVGSTFWCELPFERASADDRPPDEAAPAERPSGPRLSGVHCLVVDDSPLNQEVVERALRREGARVTLVADGQQALDRLRAQPQDVDAVLMDIQMPVMDGLTATRAIRQELGLTELPVIAFSAGVLAEQRQQAREAGVSDFLAKPVDLDELVAVLRRWTDPQPAVAPVAEPQVSTRRQRVGVSRHPWHRSPAGGSACSTRTGHSFCAWRIGLPPILPTQPSRRNRIWRAVSSLPPATAAYPARPRREPGRPGTGARRAATGDRTRDPRADPAPALADFDTRLRALLSALSPWLEGAAPVPDADPMRRLTRPGSARSARPCPSMIWRPWTCSRRCNRRWRGATVRPRPRRWPS